MIPNHLQNLIVLCVLLVVMTGCDSNYPNVSGQVTVNGQPVAEVNVLFVPVSTQAVPFPGPYAQGVTDAEGRYTLVTRHGSNGGTPGPNIVEFYAGGTIELDFMQSDAARLLGEARGNVNHPSYQEGQNLVAKIKAAKALATGSRLDPGAKTEFSVPELGTDTADFELTELAELNKTKN